MSTLVKAILEAVDGEGKNIELMFNPEEISFTRSVKWEPAKASKGKTLLPKVNFSGVEPYKLTLKQLVFDTYESKESVMKAIDNIKKGVELAEGTSEKRPPIYLLTWGKNEYFHCVITSLTYKLNMFLADGTPVRAMVDISLQEVDKPNQSKTDAKPASKGAARTNSKPPPKASPVPPRKKPK
jgi:hypothetical protein